MSRWLGALPAGWSESRLDHVARAWTSNVDKHSVEGQPAVRLCNYTDVYKNASITGDLTFMAATATMQQVDRFRLALGDTVITKDSETADDIGIPAFVEYEAPDLVCGYHLAIVRPHPEDVVPRYLYWVMTSEPTLRQWAVLASGVTRVGIRSGDLSKVAIPFPPRDEQRAIADFLDRETARIDTLIAKQEELISTLRERRRALISHAVVPSPHDTDASGWREVPFVRCMTTQIDYRGATPRKVSSGVRLVTARNIRSGWIDYETSAEFIDPADYEQVMRRGLPEIGDLVFTMEAPLGHIAVIDRTDIALAQRVIKWRVNRDIADPRFLVYTALGSSFQHQLEMRATGSTALGIKASKLPELRVSLPPLAEQRRIALYLDEQTRKIDALIKKTEDFIDLSKERRSALITAAVTGQIDVRQEVA